MGTELQLLERRCPTCGAGDPAPAVASRRRAEDLGWEELQQYWDHFFKEKVFFSYSRCRQCGLLYCPKYFDEQMLQRLYSATQHDMVGLPLEAVRRAQRGYFETLKRHSPLRGNFLEIGPDVGFFTECCAREGHFERFYLFEPSRAAHQALAGRVAGQDFRIYADMFAPALVPERSTSVAVMIHVLDHLIDPTRALRDLRERLAGDGVVLLVTHDESSLMARVFRQSWPPYCLLHPQLYNPSSMRQFLASTGYRALEISKTYNHYPATYLLKHLLSALGLRKIKVPQWNGLKLPLKLGNIITVAAPDR
jgi:hypothetical protein